MGNSEWHSWIVSVIITEYLGRLPEKKVLVALVQIISEPVSRSLIGRIEPGRILFHKETGGLWLVLSSSPRVGQWGFYGIKVSSEKEKEDWYARDSLFLKKLNQTELQEGMTLICRYAHDPAWRDGDLTDEAVNQLCLHLEQDITSAQSKNIVRVIKVEQKSENFFLINVHIVSGCVGTGMSLAHIPSKGWWSINSLLQTNNQEAAFHISSHNPQIVIEEGMELVGWFGNEKNPLQDDAAVLEALNKSINFLEGLKSDSPSSIETINDLKEFARHLENKIEGKTE